MEEAEIIERARNGDYDAFEELILKYKKLIYNLCLRMMGERFEAEDAAQEAFIKIYRGLNKYNGQSKFSTWAFKITSNMCIDMLRKRKVEVVPIDDYAISDDLSPEKSFLASEMKANVKKAVMSLPEKYRIIIIYFHFMNLSYLEICDILNESMTIVKNRIYRARLMLKDILDEEKEGYDGLQRNITTYNEIS